MPVNVGAWILRALHPKQGTQARIPNTYPKQKAAEPGNDSAAEIQWACGRAKLDWD